MTRAQHPRMPTGRFSRYFPVVVAAVPIAVAAVVYGRSEARLRDFVVPPAFAREIPTDLATVNQGERIARTRGCFGCHGERLQGHDWSKEWKGSGRVIAPNLARYAREESAATIEAAVRHGIGRDGRALWSMPAYNFVHLTDDDLVALIAYLRAHPVFDVPLPKPAHALEVRWDVAFGGGTHMAEWVAATPPLITDSARDGAQVVRGEYLAMTACNECHGLDVRGALFDGDSVPDLAIGAGYSDAEFRTLLRTGVARDGRTDLGLMSNVAQSRFVHLSEGQVADLQAFIRTLPARQAAPDVFWRERH